VPKKPIIRVVLSPEEKRILDIICTKLGQTESETLRYAFMSYAKEMGAIEEHMRSFQKHEKEHNKENE